MKGKNKGLICILGISIFIITVEIGHSIFLSANEFPNGWQTFGKYDEILEDQDRIITPTLYLRVGDSIYLSLTLIPQESQNSGVIVELHTPDKVIDFPEDRTYGIKTVNKSVVLNASSPEGNYWFEVLNPGGAGGDEIQVFGQCFYYHVEVLPDPIPIYDVFQVGDTLTYEAYDRGNWDIINYAVIWRVPDYIQFENDNPYYVGWDTIIVHTSNHSLNEFFYDNVIDGKFLPFNYNLSALDEMTLIDPVFYDAQTLVQTNSGIIIAENTIINETTIFSYITTLEYTITEIIPVKGVTWKYNYYNNTDASWTNYSVRLQVHEPTGIPISLDMVVTITGYYSNLRYYYRLIDSDEIFKTKKFPTEDLIEHITVTETINTSVTETISNTEVVSKTKYVTEATSIIDVVSETKHITETSWVTEGTVITKQTADFVALSFIALAIVGIAIKRKRSE